MTWNKALLACWMCLFLWADRHAIFPVGYWIEVRALTISDGVCPGIALDRTVRRPFPGHWQVVIDERMNGGWHLRTQHEGYYPYTPGISIIDRDLRWLTEDDTICDRLPPGEYRARVTWKVFLENGGVKSEHIVSNQFTKESA